MLWRTHSIRIFNPYYVLALEEQRQRVLVPVFIVLIGRQMNTHGFTVCALAGDSSALEKSHGLCQGPNHNF